MFNHNHNNHGASNIIPKTPEKCPICGEKQSSDACIFGRHHDYILELKAAGGTKADMILIRGWYCSIGRKKGVHGTVIAYMLNGVRVETVSHDHAYILFDGDKISS
uniref:Uncharacterized protein n=1 Tax=viral metagenome TaxID=1070528 RepID=A0A6M3LNE0_9ZZZZ